MKSIDFFKIKLLLSALVLCSLNPLRSQINLPMEAANSHIEPTKEKAHPNFVKFCPDEYWYSSSDEFSPFGSDEGYDLFYEFTEWRSKNQEGDVYKFALGVVGRKFGSKPTRESMAPYIADMRKNMPGLSDAEFEKLLTQALGTDFTPYIRTNLISASFCQLYVDGRIDTQLLDLSLIALQDELDPENLSKMFGDIEGYKESLLKQRTALEAVRSSQ
jgi:uncharacterized protein YfeS